MAWPIAVLSMVIVICITALLIVAMVLTSIKSVEIERTHTTTKKDGS